MSNDKQAKLLDGYWVIETNKWDAKIYTQEQAEKYADTLFNCDNCINCSYCRSCSDCSSCSNCSYCSYCRSCSDCSNCNDCNSCRYCRSCGYCSYCRSCSDCSSCSNCSDCSSCSDFKTNPERIISPKIGSRNSHTTYYFTDEHEQIMCGCFRGTLEEFELKVKETHGDNQHAQNYFQWIERVKLYKGGNK